MDQLIKKIQTDICYYICTSWLWEGDKVFLGITWQLLTRYSKAAYGEFSMSNIDKWINLRTTCGLC